MLFFDGETGAGGEFEAVGGAPRGVGEDVGGVEVIALVIEVGVGGFERGAGEAGERREWGHERERGEARGQIRLR